MKVVVGVDGSPGSSAALRLALDEGDALCVPVVVVQAWQVPALPSYASVLTRRKFRTEAAENALRTLGRLIEEAQSLRRQPGPAVSAVAVEGDAADVLVRIATADDRLVVATHGRAGLRRVMGSVSACLVQSARCPLILVPTGHRTGTSETRSAVTFERPNAPESTDGVCVPAASLP